MKSQKFTPTPKFLQLLVVWTVLGTTALDLVIWVNRAIQQVSTNSTFSGFVPILLYHFVTLVVLVIAYVLITRKLSVLQKLFESVLIVVAAQMILTILSMITMEVGSMLQISLYDTGRTVEIGSALVSIGAVLVCLIAARRKKLW